MVRNEASVSLPHPTSAHISALLRFLASVMISCSRTETSSRGGVRRSSMRPEECQASPPCPLPKQPVWQTVTHPGE